MFKLRGKVNLKLQDNFIITPQIGKIIKSLIIPTLGKDRRSQELFLLHRWKRDWHNLSDKNLSIARKAKNAQSPQTWQFWP